MENNSELFNLFSELRHEFFDAKIKIPMEPYLHASSNVISMNAITANTMEKSKLGEASFYDLFSFPSLGEKIFSDNTLSPICDNSNDACDILNPPTESTSFKIPMKLLNVLWITAMKGMELSIPEIIYCFCMNSAGC